MKYQKKYLFLLIALLFCGFTLEGIAQKKQHTTAKKKAVVAEKKKPELPKITANYGKYDFSFTTLDGKKIHLSDYAGKAVLVNIWAPWCGPCRIETPGFLKMYDEYKAKGFEIIGVAVQTNEGDVRSFIAKENISWPVGIEDDVAVKYGTYGLPDNYLFNPDGTVQKHFIGYTREESLRPNIEEALKKIIPASSTK